MKKRNLKLLKLNKNAISNLESIKAGSQKEFEGNSLGLPICFTEAGYAWYCSFGICR